MILDSSAVVAILFREPGAEVLVDKLAGTPAVGIGAPTLVETTIVTSHRLGRDGRGLLARFLNEASVAVVPFGDMHAAVATEAWLRYGKSRHRAALNYGDCLAYAVAKVANQPLLCVGNDFPETDLDLA